MKFYMIEKNAIKPKLHHKIIEIFSLLVINLSNDELSQISSWKYEFKNFKDWSPSSNFHCYSYLNSKHLFVKTGNYDNGTEKGINSFELNEYDLMYMKLMDWIKEE